MKDARDVAMTTQSSDFLRDRDGAVAIVFAVLLIPILLITGAAIDYARLVRDRSQLQAAVDSAALSTASAARLALQTGDFSALQRDATASLQAQTADPAVVVTVYRRDPTTFCVKATRIADLTLGALAGASMTQVSSEACAAMPTGVEVALALDNSGSMGNSLGVETKMQALQAAASDLVDILAPGNGSTEIVISVVPFAASVNVGASSRGAGFLDSTGSSSIHWLNYVRPFGSGWLPPSRFELFDAMSTPWAGCVEERPAPFLTTDAPPRPGMPDTLFVPYLAPDEAGPATGSHVAANGAVSYNSYLADDGGSCQTGDLSDQADVAHPLSQGSGATKICKYNGQAPAKVDSAISDGTAMLPSGPNLGCIATPLQTLTTAGQTAIKGPNGILASMTASGDTNLLSGLMWGWRTLSPNGPFANVGAASGPGLRRPERYDDSITKKVIVLMTDGQNHWVERASPFGSMYTSLGYFSDGRLSAYAGSNGYPNMSVGGTPTTTDNSRQQMDAAFQEACANAKAAGVKIFTIAFSTSDTPIDTDGRTQLQMCASDAKSALLANDSLGLRKAFQQIASDIKRLRLVR
jgi:Flp pilus assembly protein TadG